MQPLEGSPAIQACTVRISDAVADTAAIGLASRFLWQAHGFRSRVRVGGNRIGDRVLIDRLDRAGVGARFVERDAGVDHRVEGHLAADPRAPGLVGQTLIGRGHRLVALVEVGDLAHLHAAISQLVPSAPSPMAIVLLVPSVILRMGTAQLMSNMPRSCLGTFCG